MISRKMRTLLSVLMVVLVLGSGVMWYLLKVKPLENQISTLESSILSEQALIDQYETGNGKSSETTEEVQNTLSLQKKVPVVDNVDQFLLLLEEAEVVSGSLISNVSFSKSTQATPDETTLEEDIETLEGGARGEEQEQPESTAPTLPAGLEKLTATLTVESDHYFQLEAFVRQVEQFERITNVESLQFNGFQEISNLEELPEEQEVLTYNLTLSTYYFPKLEELKDQAPKYEPLNPAEKKNPLYQSEIPDSLGKKADVNAKQDKEAEKYKVVEKDGKTYHVYSYNVKRGDTLFQLSIQYYNSEKGIDLIRSWNNMKRLLAGTTIKIPVPADSEI